MFFLSFVVCGTDDPDVVFPGSEHSDAVEIK